MLPSRYIEFPAPVAKAGAVGTPAYPSETGRRNYKQRPLIAGSRGDCGPVFTRAVKLDPSADMQWLQHTV